MDQSQQSQKQEQTVGSAAETPNLAPCVAPAVAATNVTAMTVMDQCQQIQKQEQTVGSAAETPNLAPCVAPAVAAPTVTAPMPSPTLTQISDSQSQPADHQAQDTNDQQNKCKVSRGKEKQQADEPTNFKKNIFPLTRIKRIMQADRDVKMIAAEAPVVLAKACEMFIVDLTLRAWSHTQENRRRTLQPSDIGEAIAEDGLFDFLDDIFQEDEPNPEYAPVPHMGSSNAISALNTSIYSGEYEPQPMTVPQVQPNLHQQPYMPWPQQPFHPMQQHKEPFHPMQQHKEQPSAAPKPTTNTGSNNMK